MSIEREFVFCMEQNHKEKENFIYYLQWNGNEEQLSILNDAINRSSIEATGDCVTFMMTLDIKIPEFVVDHNLLLNPYMPNGYANAFTKCTGQMKLPFTREDFDHFDEYEMMSFLDETFFSYHIPKLFK